MRTLLLAAGLLVCLAGCSSSNEAIIRQQQDELALLRTENERLRLELEAALDRAAQPAPPPETSPEQGETVAVLLMDLLFESGSATLTPAGVEKLAEVVGRIKEQYPGLPLRIEGHTDSNPIGDRLKQIYPSNWELSAARAATVVRHLQWTHDLAAARMEVVGFGSYRPIAANTDAEGRRQNRRVRIAVLLN